ncbi:hypothetical protein Peur_020413 [Populus x canadensis]
MVRTFRDERSILHVLQFKITEAFGNYFVGSREGAVPYLEGFFRDESDGFVSRQEALKLHETETNIIHLSWRFSFTSCPDSIYSSKVLILKLSRIDSILSYEFRKATWSLKRTRGTSGIRVSICSVLSAFGI